MLSNITAGAIAAITLGFASGYAVSADDQAARKSTEIARGQKPPLLHGVVKLPSGEPLSGVTVSAKVSGAPVTVSVFTDAHGAYYFPPLHTSGRYAVWAQAVGYERALTMLDIASGVARADLTMTPTDNVLPQLSGWQQAMALPEDTREHRRAKAVLLKACIQCHQLSRVFAARFDQQGWAHIIDAMARSMSSSSAPRPGLEKHRADLAAYLNETIGPKAAPLKLTIPPRPTGDAALPVIYEYSFPNLQGMYPFDSGNDWSKGPPIATGFGTGLHDATVDLQGNVWFTNPYPSAERTIGRIDGRTGDTTSFRYQGAEPDSTGKSHGIVTARDGTLWFTLAYGSNLLASHLGFMDPRTLEQKIYRVPRGMAAVGGWLNEDGMGNIWTAAGAYQGGEGALRFDRKTQQFQQFKSLSDGMTYGVAGDKDGNGWWAQINVDIMGYVDTKTGKIGEIRLPFTWGGAPFLKAGDMSKDEYLDVISAIGPTRGGSQMPRRMKADLLSDHVWVANYAANSLVRIDSKTRQITSYPAPTPGMAPYDIGVDSKHGVWVGLQNGDEVARFDPTTAQWTLYPLPSKGVSARSLMVVEREGRVEVILPENDNHKVARLIVRTAADLTELKKKYYQ